MNASRLFILRPVATTLLMVAIFLTGLIAYRLLPVSALPEVHLAVPERHDLRALEGALALAPALGPGRELPAPVLARHAAREERGVGARATRRTRPRRRARRRPARRKRRRRP